MRKTLLITTLLGFASGLGATNADETLKALRYGTPEAQERALDEVLAGHVPEAGPALLDLLGEMKGIDKLKVIRALGVVKEGGAVKPLLGLLDDRTPELRVNVIRTLGHIGDPSASGAIVGMLKDDDPEMREAAALSLGECGTPEDVAPLGAALSDPNRLVELAAVDALGSLGSSRAFTLLKPLLKNADANLKRHVVLAIGSLRSADMNPYLKALLKDHDPYLRGASAEALAQRPRDAALEKALIARLDDPVYAVQVRAVEALGIWKSEAAVPALIKALRSDEPTLRWKAVLALGQIGDTRAIDPLEYLRDHDSEEEIRGAATEALKGLK